MAGYVIDGVTGGPGWGNTAYNGIIGKAPPERDKIKK